MEQDYFSPTCESMYCHDNVCKEAPRRVEQETPKICRDSKLDCELTDGTSGMCSCPYTDYTEFAMTYCMNQLGDDLGVEGVA